MHRSISWSSTTPAPGRGFDRYGGIDDVTFNELGAREITLTATASQGLRATARATANVEPEPLGNPPGSVFFDQAQVAGGKLRSVAYVVGGS